MAYHFIDKSMFKEHGIELSHKTMADWMMRCAERAIKPFVIGRKNWQFSQTATGANASTVLYINIEGGLLVSTSFNTQMI